MEEIIQKWKEQLQKKLAGKEPELLPAFEEYLQSGIDCLAKEGKLEGKENEAYACRIIESIAKRIVESDLIVQEQMLLKDENFQKITESSSRSYQLALKILNGEEIEEEFDSKEEQKKLSEWKKGVKSFNRERADELVSEASLDWGYVENPHIDIVSLRLGKEMRWKNNQKRGRNNDEKDR